MKTAEEIIAKIVADIGRIYWFPWGFCYDAHDAEARLGYYHGLWAFITESTDHLHSAADRIWCNSFNFATIYGREHPEAADAEVVKFVIQQYKKIDNLLGLIIPVTEEPSDGWYRPDSDWPQLSLREMEAIRRSDHGRSPVHGIGQTA